HRSQSWRTNAYPDDSTEDYTWQVSRMKFSQSDSIVCAIGLLRDIAADVSWYCEVTGFGALPRIFISGTDAIKSPQHANKAVQLVKSQLADAITQCGARRVHLFLATPSHFALFLGHRLNATC